MSSENTISFHLDVSAIAKARQRAQKYFSVATHAHREIAMRLLERLTLLCLSPKIIVIYGWQASAFIAELHTQFPHSEMRVIEDLLTLSQCAENTADLIVSHLTLHWENAPLTILQQCHRILKPECPLFFTTLGPDTLVELQQSFAAVDNEPHVHVFTDMHHIADAMRRLQFDGVVADMEKITLAYDALDMLFQDLKNTASVNADSNRRRGLLSKNKWQAMLAQYQQLKIDDYYPATLEIIYGHGWKAASHRHESLIPVEKIMRKKQKN